MLVSRRLLPGRSSRFSGICRWRDIEGNGAQPSITGDSDHEVAGLEEKSVLNPSTEYRVDVSPGHALPSSAHVLLDFRGLLVPAACRVKVAKKTHLSTLSSFTSTLTLTDASKPLVSSRVPLQTFYPRGSRSLFQMEVFSSATSACTWDDQARDGSGWLTMEQYTWLSLGLSRVRVALREHVFSPGHGGPQTGITYAIFKCRRR